MMDWIPGAPADRPVLVADDGPVRRIVLNRPAAHNAVNQQMADLLETTLDDFDARPELRVAIVCGNGKNFCAGMDLREFLDEGIPMGATRGFGGFVENPSRKPLIAAVHGAALAGGFEIALACDLIVASESARFGLPEVTRGLVAAAGGLIRLPRAVPVQVAMRAALTGEPLDARTAAGFGLVADLATDDDDLVHRSAALATRIAANAPLAVAASKRVLTDSYGLEVAEAFTRQRDTVSTVFASDDAREGAASFAERRAPEWRGR